MVAGPHKKTGGVKVCVCGGAGGIGQPLSLLMAMDERVGELCVQDVTMAMVPAAGVAADLSHLELPAKVKAFAIDPTEPVGPQLRDCLTGCDLVLVPAGLPRKPGMTRDDLFAINAGIARGIVEACAEYCPEAVLGLIVNPVNSIVPAMAEIYKEKGLDPRKVCGVTTLDAVRANKFLGEAVGVSPTELEVPVVGGHAGATILPLFSQVPSAKLLTKSEIEALDKRVQDAGTEVVNAKGGMGSATLSMAYAGARFAKAVISGLHGTPTTECAYVVTPEDGTVSKLPYFSSKVTFGLTGPEKVHPVGDLSPHEQTRLDEATAQLKGEIEKGVEYAKQQKRTQEEPSAAQTEDQVSRPGSPASITSAQKRLLGRRPAAAAAAAAWAQTADPVGSEEESGAAQTEDPSAKRLKA